MGKDPHFVFFFFIIITSSVAMLDTVKILQLPLFNDFYTSWNYFFMVFITYIVISYLTDLSCITEWFSNQANN